MNVKKNLTSKLHRSFNGPFVEVIVGHFGAVFSPVNSFDAWSNNLKILPVIIFWACLGQVKVSYET